MAARTPRRPQRQPHPADDAPVRQHVALEICEGAPVAQHLRPVGGAPDEVQGLQVLRQQRGAGAPQGESTPRPEVGAHEVHPVDACHAGLLEPEGRQDGRERGRVAPSRMITAWFHEEDQGTVSPCLISRTCRPSALSKKSRRFTDRPDSERPNSRLACQ